jgi:hypothetical protein
LLAIHGVERTYEVYGLNKEDSLKLFSCKVGSKNKMVDSSYEYISNRVVTYAHYGYCIKSHILVLVDKSLIKIDFDYVTLHDLIEDMGKEIVT